MQMLGQFHLCRYTQFFFKKKSAHWILILTESNEKKILFADNLLRISRMFWMDTLSNGLEIITPKCYNDEKM